MIMGITRLFTVALFLNVPALFACSCATAGSYCSALGGTKIVFVGHVTEDSGEGSGKGPAKMMVDEVLHGLPKGARELTVDTGAGTSCYMRLAKGERYVIYGSPIEGTTNRINRDWCSFSFSLAGNETLLAALRQAEIKADATVVGKVQVMDQEFNVSGEGAPGVRVEATSGKIQLETMTRANGEFEFHNVSPGEYRIKILSPDYFEDKFRFPSTDPAVEPSGCGYQNLFVWPNGRIEGTVRGPDGKPVEGVTVQAFTNDSRGELGNSALREAKTGLDGKYSLSGLPPGEVVIGVNAEKYADRTAWPPTFYPSASDRDMAMRIIMDRGKGRTGIDLQLPPPRTPAVLHFEAVFEDGSPAPGTSASVESVSGIQRVLGRGNDQTNLLDVPVYQGETYIVRGSKVSVFSGSASADAASRMRVSRWKGLSAPVQVDGPDVRVRVVLHEEKLPGK